MATLYLDEDDVEEEEEEEEEDSESDDENGGYDYAFVDPGPSDDQMCPICRLVARKARQANCCGKIFCKGCLEKLRQHSDEFKCPICRKRLGKRYFKDKRMEREILHLQINCTNKNKGCSWLGILKDISTHNKECHNQEVTCDKCTQNMQRHQLEVHVKDKCVKRDFKCVHCQIVGKYDDITGRHQEVCPDVILPCKNRCTQKVKRCDMKQHRDICPNEIIKCPYYDIGCEKKMKREDIDQHEEDSTKIHLKMAAEKIKDKPALVRFIEFSIQKEEEDV